MNMKVSLAKFQLLGISVIFLMVAAGTPCLAQTTVSFQEGVGGYTGLFDVFISLNATQVPNGRDGNVLGSSVTQKFVDGRYAEQPTNNTEAGNEVQYLLRFDNMFGAGAGLIPLGAKITNASLTLTSGDGNFAETNGVYGLAQMLVPFNELTTWTSLSNGFDAGAAFIGGASDRPVDHSFKGPIAKSTLTPVQTSADITRIVQNWSSGTTNNGLLLRSSTNDGWQVMTSGAVTPGLRPKLDVTYTTAPQPTTTAVALQQGVNGYSGTIMARLDAGANDGMGGFPDQETIDGSTLETAALDGPNLSNTSYDQLALIKFNNIFVSQGGTVPDSATILDAQLIVDTGSPVVDLNAHTPGDFGVHRMLVDWNTTSLYTDFSGDGPDEADGEIGPVLDVTGAVIADARVYFDVTSAVDAWQSGSSNFGLALRYQDTADGWGIKFTGSDSPPQLLINYTIGSDDADFDNSGDVDGRDFLIWQRGFGSGTTNATGDANGDGTVNSADLAIWQNQYGGAPLLSSLSAVPEPSTLLIAFVASLSLLAGARGARRSLASS